MSESRASDTCSNNDDVNVAVAVEGSAFSGGGCDVLRARSRGSGRSGIFLPYENQIVERNEAQHGAYDASKRVGVPHFEEPLRNGDDGAVCCVPSLSLYICFAGLVAAM